MVVSAQFSPDSGRVVTASYDGTARVWDAATGKVLAVLRGHAGEVTSAQFSLDGKKVVTAGVDGKARLYLVYLDDLITLAEARITRELTCEERVQYLHENLSCPTPTPYVP
jgi:WD40 repeat protein